MLFDPFEKQFNLPSFFIKLTNHQSWELEIIGQEVEIPVLSFVEKFDAPQWLRINLPGPTRHQADGLVAAQAKVLINGPVRNHSEADMAFVSDYEEGSFGIEAAKPGKI